MIKNQRVFWSGQYLFPDTDDPGDEPDVGLLEGTVTFAPVWDAGVSGLLSDSQRSTYVKPFPIEIRDGQLMSNDDGTWIPGAKIPASIGGHPLSWVARFDLSAGGEKVTVRELRFTSNPDGEVHLHNVIPAEAIFPQLPPDIVKGDSVTNIYTQGQYVVFIVGDPPRTKQYVLAFPGTDEAIAAAEAAVVEFEQLRDAGVLAIEQTRTSAESAIGQARDEVQGLKDDATTQAGIATTKAGEAGGFRDEAEGFKNDASTQAGIATTKAGEAATSAANAKTSETNAKTSETNAASSSGAASDSASTATTRASEASASALAASGAEARAKTSEINAKTSEDNAKISEDNAKSSETKSKTSETNAKTSETNALASKNAAATSAANAGTSEANAKTSETNAAASATKAQQHVDEFDLNFTSTTLPPETGATVAVTGDGPAYSVEIGVPQGIQGVQGPPGEVSQAMLDAAVASLVDGAPESLNALSELAAALGNDPNFATTVSTEIGKRVLIDGAPAAYNTLGKLVTALQNHELGGSTDASLLTGALTDQVDASGATVPDPNTEFATQYPLGNFVQEMVEAIVGFYDALLNYAPLGHLHDGADISGALTAQVNVGEALFAPTGDAMEHMTVLQFVQAVFSEFGNYSLTNHKHPVSDFTATGTASSSTYLRGDGTWATPPNTNTTYAVPSQAEAEAGTATTGRAFSAQRVRQAADAAISARVQLVSEFPASPVAGVLYLKAE